MKPAALDPAKAVRRVGPGTAAAQGVRGVDPPHAEAEAEAEVDDFDAVVRRAKALRAKVLQKPHVNPAPMHREIWLQDPDGYVVVVCSPDGEAGKRVRPASR